MNVIGAQKLSHVEMTSLSETSNEHMAEGLAWNYYYNYLKIVLPYLHETIDKAVFPDYIVNEADMCDVISVRKLFIIISKNCNYYRGLIEADIDHVWNAGYLPSFYINRADVESQPYQNSVYRVHTPGKPPIYVIMEFAFPVLAMNDLYENSKSSFSMEDRDVQVINFYNKLKYILNNDSDIGDRCVLVLYSKVYSSSGRNLSDVIYECYEKEKGLWKSGF